MKRRLAAFTLIELLVVVVIIAILAALLSPALKSGIASSNSVKCVGNLKQIYAAALLWSADNNGRIPPMNDSLPYALVDNEWNQARTTLGILAPYLGHESIADLRSAKEFPVFICPANTNRSLFGYGMNYAYLSWGTWPDPIWKTFAEMGGRSGGLSKTVFWCDSEMRDPQPNFTDGDSWRPWVRPPSSDGFNRPSFRHPGKTAHVLWLDGHVSAEKEDRTDRGWMDACNTYWGNYERNQW